MNQIKLNSPVVTNQEIERLSQLKKEIQELHQQMVEQWVNFRENGGEGGAENYKKWEANNPLAGKISKLNEELENLKWVEDEIQKREIERIEKLEAEELEKSQNEFWITTPNYDSLEWGSKKVKVEFVDELGEDNSFNYELSSKKIKIGDDWFRMVKLDNKLFPNWLERRENELVMFYIPSKKIQEQVAFLQWKTLGDWKITKEVKVSPKWINSSKIRWLIENKIKNDGQN